MVLDEQDGTLGDTGAANQVKNSEDQGGYTLVEPKSLKKHSDEIESKEHVVGIQITKTAVGNSVLTLEQLQTFMEVIADFDPNAFVMDHTNNKAKGMPVVKANAKIKDFMKFLGADKTNWGPPKDRKTKTSCLLCVASNVIKENLKDFKQSFSTKHFMDSVNCQIQPSRLIESRSKLIGTFEGKDPNHTNRKQLAERMEFHLTEFNKDKKKIRVNVVPCTERGIRALAFTVGMTQAKMAEAVLEEKEFEDVQITLHSWKRTNESEHNERLQFHRAVCDNSTALKITKLDAEAAKKIRNDLNDSEAGKAVVDVFPATHNDTTGAVHVQCLRDHKEAVVQEVKEILEHAGKHINPLCSTFQGEDPELMEGGESVTPTRETDPTRKRTPTQRKQVPASNFADLLVPKEIVIQEPQTKKDKRPDSPIPKTAWGKEHRNAVGWNYNPNLLRGGGDSDPDDNSKKTLQASNSRSGKRSMDSSIKSMRELELEAENARLKEVNTKLQEDMSALKEEINRVTTEANAKTYKLEKAISDQNESHQLLEQKMEAMLVTITELGKAQQAAALQNSMADARESPTRKQPPSKRPDTKKTPQKAKQSSSVINSTMTTLFNIVAPEANQRLEDFAETMNMEELEEDTSHPATHGGPSENV